MQKERERERERERVIQNCQRTADARIFGLQLSPVELSLHGTSALMGIIVIVRRIASGTGCACGEMAELTRQLFAWLSAWPCGPGMSPALAVAGPCTLGPGIARSRLGCRGTWGTRT